MVLTTNFFELFLSQQKLGIFLVNKVQTELLIVVFFPHLCLILANFGNIRKYILVFDTKTLKKSKKTCQTDKK